MRRLATAKCLWAIITSYLRILMKHHTLDWQFFSGRLVHILGRRADFRMMYGAILAYDIALGGPIS